MGTSALQAHQINLGEPLPFDAYNANGVLLLRKGYILHSEDQLIRLVECGLYTEEAIKADAADAHQHHQREFTPRTSVEKISVLELLDEVQRELEFLLTDPAPENFAARLRALATQIQRAYEVDADACLAYILLRAGGRYATRRMIQSAILVELMLGAGTPVAERLPLVCAALTMNMSILDLQDTLWAQHTPPDDMQRGLIARHPEDAVAMLRARGVDEQAWLEAILQHHEQGEGKGYPAGLSGAQISRAAQLLAIVDRYGAMATGRSYRPPVLPHIVLKQIFGDKSVNSALSGQLVKSVGLYPPGSVVVLANGDTAVVTQRTANPAQPIVRCVKTYRNERLDPPRKRLTSEAAYAVARLIPACDLGFAIDATKFWGDHFEFTPV